MRIYYFGKLVQSDSPETSNSSVSNNRDEKSDLSYGEVFKNTSTQENQINRSDIDTESSGILGELDRDTENPEFNKTKTEQTSLELELSEQTEKDRAKTGMESIGDILKDLNLNIDVYRSNKLKNSNKKGGYSHA